MRFVKMVFYLAVCCFLALVLIAAVPAGGALSKETHCYALITPIDVETGSHSEIIRTACFDTFADAISAATNGRVKLDATIGPGEVTDSMLNEAKDKNPLDPSVVIGIDYDNPDYKGSSYTWLAYDGCSDSLQYEVSSMPAGWNDRVSSAIAYSECKSYHFRDTSFRGDYIVCNQNCPSMGSLDNATSSERWVKK